MIELRGISRTFNSGIDGEVQALRQIDLVLEGGKWCNLIGPNGSGKSTLLRLLAGDLQPTAGDVLLDGRSLLGERPEQRARLFFFVEQDPKANLVPTMTIEENLLLAVCNSRFPGFRFSKGKTRRAKIQEALARLCMGLENRLSTQVRLLSGGERQAIVIAKALLMSSPVLLLDEFIAAMDPRIGPLLLSTTRKLVEEEHLTAVSVTHNLEQLMLDKSRDERVVLLRRGEIVQDVLLSEISSMQWLIQQYEGLVGSIRAEK